MVNISKEESLKKISLRKKSVVSLSKARNLDNVRSRVALVLDKSGSMDKDYRSGLVQDVIERIIPLALNFDDNGELDLWIFGNDSRRLDGVTLDNFYGLADEINKKYYLGGTNYAPVMIDIADYYINEEPMQVPNYVIFLTDGDNYDKSKTTKLIKDLSHLPIFWQFVGIGNNDFCFLEKLDEMEGRYVDNANFFKVDNIRSMSDDVLYDKLLKEFPEWLKLTEVKEMLESYKTLSFKSHKFFNKVMNVLRFIVEVLT